MTLDYFMLVFISAVGVIQIAAVHAKLPGLWFFKHPGAQYVFGVLAIIGAFGWFFTTEERNVRPVVEGTQQLGLFLAGILAAYLVTAILASFIQARVTTRPEHPVEGKQRDIGMETLKTTTLLGGILSSLRKERKDKP